MARELTQRVFREVDARDPAAFSELFAHDGRLVFANGEPLIGRETIRVGVAGFYATVKGLHHQILNEWNVEHDTVVEALVTYDRLGGDSVTIPVVSIWHARDDGLIDDYRVYFDVAPVYAP
jgi:ketosteroid isomerase-like protein